jgi:hypothetical protein
VLQNGMPTPELSAALDNLRRGLTSLLKHVGNGAGHIVVLNYYQLIPQPKDFPSSKARSAGGLDLVCTGLTANKEHAYADATFIQSSINQAIADGIATARTESQVPLGIDLVDVSSVFNTHEMCTKNTAIFSGDSMPADRFARDLQNLFISRVCSFCGADAATAKADIQRYIWRAGHPNSFGQIDLADATISIVNRVLSP